MKRKFSDILVETLIGMFLTLGLEMAIGVIKAKKKKENIDSTLVADLTVGDLKQILRQEKEETNVEIIHSDIGIVMDEEEA